MNTVSPSFTGILRVGQVNLGQQKAWALDGTAGKMGSRSSSREVRISWYQLFSVVKFNRGSLPSPKKG